MPLVAHSDLPTFKRLNSPAQEVLSMERAMNQDIRELHIGLLNLMPDAALEATERQFMRLIGSCNRIAQFYVHPFTVAGVPRKGKAKEHVDRYYEDFDELRETGLDAMVVTGANPALDELSDEPFWSSMIEVIDWSKEHVSSTLCSCLATHAVLQHFYDTRRVRLPQKRWGVYSHRTTNQEHPLLSHVNTRFDAPHSHVFDLSREQIEGAGMEVLAESDEAGVYLATSADGLRFVFFQGHPEYDINSLLKEYKREVNRVSSGVRKEYPPEPENYFSPSAQPLLAAHREAVLTAKSTNTPGPEFPEDQFTEQVDNTWSDTGAAMFNNWLGLVYQLTHRDRTQLYMPGVDPNDPLGLLAQRD